MASDCWGLGGRRCESSEKMARGKGDSGIGDSAATHPASGQLPDDAQHYENSLPAK